MSSPSQALAVHILDRLVEEGVLRASDAKATVDKLATGKLKGPDWRVALEKAIDASEQTAGGRGA